MISDSICQTIYWKLCISSWLSFHNKLLSIEVWQVTNLTLNWFFCVDLINVIEHSKKQLQIMRSIGGPYLHDGSACCALLLCLFALQPECMVIPSTWGFIRKCILILAKISLHFIRQYCDGVTWRFVLNIGIEDKTYQITVCTSWKNKINKLQWSEGNNKTKMYCTNDKKKYYT